VRGICGIYTIEADGLIYVGATKNVRNRWADHVHALVLGTHENSLLQEIFTRRGPAAFSFRIVEFCERDDLPAREQFWLDHHWADGLTVHQSPSARLTGCATPGRAVKGRTMSAEHKAKIAAALVVAWKRDDGSRKAALIKRNKTTRTWAD
jgi:group I intron endonuclease